MEGYREGVNEAGGEFLDAETQYANATADLAVTAMEGIMSKYPEGVAIICSNNDDMALAAAVPQRTIRTMQKPSFSALTARSPQ